jgi:predicted metal-dependent phosphoesterase TrpH
MVYADLHVHTTRSDGTLDVGGVAGAAREAGVAVVAVTDHDRAPPFRVERREGVTLLGGVELRVEAGFGRVDLLGYAVEPTPELGAELDRIQENRVERGHEIVRRLEKRLGVTLDVAIEAGLGRPDIARAVADHPETDYTVGGVFEDLIGEGEPCYVAREVPSFERGAALLSDACPVVSLAHPLRYPDPAAALSLLSDLDAAELRYPYEGNPPLDPVERAIEEHGAIASGGSDAHGTELGLAGLDRGEFSPLASRLGLPVP